MLKGKNKTLIDWVLINACRKCSNYKGERKGYVRCFRDPWIVAVIMQRNNVLCDGRLSVTCPETRQTVDINCKLQREVRDKPIKKEKINE